ncbi:hypothetical protein ACWD6R_36550 [Streptomyces sp. NPDC005151]
MRAAHRAGVCLATACLFVAGSPAQSNSADRTADRRGAIFLSDEEFERQYGAQALKHAASGMELPTPAHAPRALPAVDDEWKKVKFTVTDPDGRKIPTRVGNSHFGWRHFSSRHNIKKYAALQAAYGDKVDKVDGHHLEYIAVVVYSGRVAATVRGVVQYYKQTGDGERKVPRKEKIGTITAYCQGVQKCPSVVNG